jgi:nicotinate-nucleotide--dimethylbenzimidazole phosphoribosyltransferase
MATEPQRSEIMSGAPSSSELASPRPPQTDVSADAALIMAALGRMEATVRHERAAFDRLRVMLGEMAEAIAKAKAVADSETSANLLDELDHRVDAMMEIAGHGAVAESAPSPPPQPPSSAAQLERDAALLAHGASEAQGAAAAPDAGAVAQAIQHPAESDQVPTVSDVVSRLESDDGTPPAATDIPPVADAAISAPTVAMLTAMVEALRDSIAVAAPGHQAAIEVPAPQAAEVVAQPLDEAPQLATSSIEMAVVTTLTAKITEAVGTAHEPAQETAQETTQETTQETAHLIEAPQAGELAPATAATPAIGTAETANVPPPSDAAPDESPIAAILSAAAEASSTPALEPATPIEALQPSPPAVEIVAQPLDLVLDLAPQDLAPQDLAPQDLAPSPETTSNEITASVTPAAEIAELAEAARIVEAPQAEAATRVIEVAEAAAVPPPAPAPRDNAPIIAMLTARLAALRAAAEAAAREPAAPLETPQPAPPAAEAVAPPQDLAPQGLAPQDLAPQPESSSNEIAEAAAPAAEIAQIAEAAPVEEAPQAMAATQAEEAGHAAEVADAAPVPGPSATGLDESALLASLEQMETRPFPPPDVGTAVIFGPKPEFEFLPEFEREAAAPSETAPEAEQPVALQPEITVTPVAEMSAEIATTEITPEVTHALAAEPALSAAEVATGNVERALPIEPTAEPAAAMAPAEVAAETSESDFDPADFLFEPEPEPDPAEDLLDPAPPPSQVKAGELPRPEFVAPPARQDPLHALKAMSENEKIALFS